jgi:hypothetical protein
MFCPNCESLLNCSCSACYKRSSKSGGKFVIRLDDEELYQCPICKYKFSESESADYEWDRMIEDWAKVATKEHCYHWILDKRKIESELNFDNFMMSRCFFHHFNENPDNIDILKFIRDYKLNKILN